MNKKLDLSNGVIIPDMFKNIDISNLLSAAEYDRVWCEAAVRMAKTEMGLEMK